MFTPETVDALLEGCAFVDSPEAAMGLVCGPGVPSPRSLTPDHVGWGIVPPPELELALVSRVSATVAASLGGRGGGGDQSYATELEGALLDTHARHHEPWTDALVWLHVADLAQRALAADDELLERLENHDRALSAAARRPLDELARTARSNPGRAAAIRREVAGSLHDEHTILAQDVRLRTGESNEGLLNCLGETPLLLLLPPSYLHHTLRLEPILLGRSDGVGEETFRATWRLVHAVVEEVWRRRAGRRAGAAERWFVSYFLPDSLRDKAAALEPGALPGGVDGDLSVRVARLGALNPDLAEYVLHHADQFIVSDETAERFGVRRSELAMLADPETLSLRSASYRSVVTEILRWDLLNAARGLLHRVDSASGHYFIDGSRVARPELVLDLTSPRGPESLPRTSLSLPPERPLPISSPRTPLPQAPPASELGQRSEPPPLPEPAPLPEPRPTPSLGMLALGDEPLELMTEPDEDGGFDIFSSVPEFEAWQPMAESVDRFGPGLADPRATEPDLSPRPFEPRRHPLSDPAAAHPDRTLGSVKTTPWPAAPTAPSAGARRAPRIPSASLLGVLDRDFADRLAEFEMGPLQVDSAISLKEVPRFGDLFRDYVIFPIGRLGRPGAAIGIGRPYKDKMVDLHTFAVPDDPSWRSEDAVVAFLRRKIASDFLIDRVEYEPVPAGAGEMDPLSAGRLGRAWRRIHGEE